ENDRLGRDALEKNVDIEDVLAVKVREKIGRSKYIEETKLAEFDDIMQALKKEMLALTTNGGL
ncbi:MAG: hypothetical protein RR993_04755, partial [Clostridia bacterium]